MAQLIGIYNAKSGIINGGLDFLHKTFSPSTYQCELCALTYGTTGMKQKWKQFLDSLDANVIFYHTDDAPQELLDMADELPVLLWQDGDQKPEILLSKKELASLKNLEELIQSVNRKVWSIQ